MDFHAYITTRDACAKANVAAADCDAFYERALTDALAIQSAQFFFQLANERDSGRNRRPYYNVWPAIVPMLTRLNLDLDSELIQLPLPALSVRLTGMNAVRAGRCSDSLVQTAARDQLYWASMT